MSGRRLTGFVDERGEWRELRDPDGPASPRQLVALHRAGALILVEPGAGERFTKAEAAGMVDAAVAAGLLERRRPPDPAERLDRACRAIVAHVDANAGCSTSAVLDAVHGQRAYVADRVRDLLELSVLEDRARRRGPGRARELWHPNDAGAEPAGRSTT